MHINEAAARIRVQAARKRAEAAVRRARSAQKRAQSAAIWQASWQTIRQTITLFTRYTRMFWGGSGYFLLSIIGIFYSWAYYSQFHIRIFEFFDTSDFLLSAFRSPKMLLAVLVTLGVLLPLVSLAASNYKSSIERARSFATGTERESRYRRKIVITVVSGVPLITIIIIPSLWGWGASKKILGDENRHVRVTVRQDADRPAARLPYPALLLGTTSDFHFFYKCRQENERDWKCREEDKIENERVFIVPTANLSSLEFISEPEEPPSQVGLPELVTAIRDLDLNPKEINVNVSGFSNHCEFGWKKSETVGPFCESEHDRLENDKQTDCTDDQNSLISLAALEEKLSRKFQDYTLQQLMLIGRADIKPLRGQKLQDYGSNSGLAQARAKWVWKSLEQKAKIDPDRVILLSAGPLYTGSEAKDPKNREHDRSVEVYACWAPTSSSADPGS